MLELFEKGFGMMELNGGVVVVALGQATVGEIVLIFQRNVQRFGIADFLVFQTFLDFPHIELLPSLRSLQLVLQVDVKAMKSSWLVGLFIPRKELFSITREQVTLQGLSPYFPKHRRREHLPSTRSVLRIVLQKLFDQIFHILTKIAAEVHLLTLRLLMEILTLIGSTFMKHFIE